jgi:hypothetical protein
MNVSNAVRRQNLKNHMIFYSSILNPFTSWIQRTLVISDKLVLPKSGILIFVSGKKVIFSHIRKDGTYSGLVHTMGSWLLINIYC